MANPFTPGFGTTPRVVVGREQVLGEIAAAFGDARDPHRTTWLRAPRGAGKTVLLNEIQDLAGQAGWLAVQEDAQTPGDLTARIAQRLVGAAEQRAPGQLGRRRLRSVEVTTPVGGAGIEFDNPAAQAAALRDTIIVVLERHEHIGGILLSVDEIHTAPRDVVAHLGNAVQHLIRENQPVAAVVAGLPVDEGDDLATFLRRCVKPPIEELPAASVRVGLQQTAELGGGRFDADALELAVAATGGYPYMLQLVGYWSWHQTDDGHITVELVRAALPRCEHELVDGVAGLSNLRLSPGAQRYLEAMAHDDGPSSTGDIAERIGETVKSASVMRHRLISEGVIEAAGYGYVNYRIPGHRALVRVRRLLAP